MAWGWMTWFDENAGALSALAALGTLSFTVLLFFVSRRQAEIAKRQADIADKQVALQAEIHRKEGPVLVLHFSGFQSQPFDPKKEMLWLMVGIGNEGRKDVRVNHLEIELLDPTEEGFRTYALHPAEMVKHGRDSRDQYTPLLPSWTAEKAETGGLIKSHDARSFYVAIPAGAGYESWRRVLLRVTSIGVEPGTKELDWNLYWLRG